MEVCEELEILSKEFNKKGFKLYIVGGFVRDSLLGYKNEDIDIASSMPCEKVIDICKKLKIKTTSINQHLGTIQLKYNNRKFEYTRFREESYDLHGTHSPDSVSFVDDIAIDTLRRDFTINSIYYDIENNNLIDKSGGQKDLENKLIRTTNNPEKTLHDDGLRILRAIRFASTLDFSYEKKTKHALSKFAANLNLISKERIIKEIQQLVVADIKLDKPNHTFLKSCNEFTLLKYIFNSTLDKIKKFKKTEIKNFYSLSKNARLVGFYILVISKHLKYYTNTHHLSYIINVLLGINGIKESNDTIRTTEKLYRIIQNLNFNNDILNATINYLTLSDTERELVEHFIHNRAKQQLSDNISIIKDNNLPISVHQLPITAEELIEEGIERKYISKILNTLYNQVLSMKVKNTNADLKKLAKDINDTFKTINNTPKEKV